jgi:predicted nucleic acid-binding protein
MAGKARIYLESSFVFALSTPDRVGDVLQTARTAVTRIWWERRRNAFLLFVSQLVIDEAGRGDPEAAQMRLAPIVSLPLLSLTEAAETLAGELLASGLYAQAAVEDALHVALATVHGMDYFLTWDCRQFANAETTPVLQRAIEALGYISPVICTPEQLMGIEALGSNS